MSAEKIAYLVLRGGVSFAFLYPPINALFDPDSWIGYFPSFIHGFVPDVVLLHTFGVVEVVIALWILSGWKIFWPSLIATAILLTIVIFDYRDFQVLFRDVTIASMSLGLALLNFRTRTVSVG
jgi:uncharacterized membrane protein YphA (DoxX/SURF4 family)